MTRTWIDNVLVNDVDVLSVLVQYELNNTKNMGDFAKGFLFFSPEVGNLLDLVVGQSVIVSRGLVVSTEEYLMRGRITKISFVDGKVRIDVEGRLSKLKLDIFSTSYDKNIDTEAGEPSAIFKDIVEDGGFTASVVSSGTSSGDVLLDKFISNDQSRLNRMTRLAQVLNWQFYDDFNNDYVRLEPKGYTSFGTQLVVGGNVLNIPVWNEDLEPVRNFIKVKGAFEFDTREESFNGDSVEKQFVVNDTPESVEVTVGGVLQVLGETGAQTSFDFSLDKNLKTFTFSSAPTTGTNNVVIKYTTKVPKPVQGKNAVSIGLYNETRKAVYDFKDIVTVNDAETRLQTLLEFLGVAFQSTNLNVWRVPGLIPGILVDVVDSSRHKKSGKYVVSSVIYQYPSDIDIVKVGSSDFSIRNLFSSIDARLEELENKDIFNTEILTQILQNEGVIGVRSTKDLYTASPESGVLYWDDDNQGTWGNDAGTTGYNWGDDTDETETLSQRVHTAGYFLEDLWDTDFVDTTNTTAVVSTSAHTISFSSGNGLLTNLVSYFKFDTSNATQPDSHGSNNGTVSGASYTSSGIINGGYLFDGVNDSMNADGVSTSIGATPTKFSVSYWFKRTARVDYDVHWMIGDSAPSGGSGSAGLYMGVGSYNTDNLWYWGYYENIDTGFTLVDGVWYHIVFTLEGSTSAKIYVNGSLEWSSTVNNRVVVDAFSVGKDISSSSHYTNGVFDEVSVFSDTLTQAQVTSIYNSGSCLPYSDYSSSSRYNFFSDTVFKNKTTSITSARLSIPASQITGSTNLKYYMRVDGTNWEEASLNTTLTFANSGTQLDYKIVASNTSSITFVDDSGRSNPLKIEVNI